MSHEDMRAAMSSELRGLVMGSAPSLETFGTDINCLYDSDEDHETRSASHSPPLKPPRGRTPEPPQRPRSPAEEAPPRAKSPSFEEWSNSILKPANLEHLLEHGTESQKQAAKAQLADAAAHGSAKADAVLGKQEQRGQDAGETPEEDSPEETSGTTEQQGDDAGQSSAQESAHPDSAFGKSEHQGRNAAEKSGPDSGKEDLAAAQTSDADAGHATAGGIIKADAAGEDTEPQESDAGADAGKADSQASEQDQQQGSARQQASTASQSFEFDHSAQVVPKPPEEQVRSADHSSSQGLYRCSLCRQQYCAAGTRSCCGS